MKSRTGSGGSTEPSTRDMVAGNGDLDESGDWDVEEVSERSERSDKFDAEADFLGPDLDKELERAQEVEDAIHPDQVPSGGMEIDLSSVPLSPDRNTEDGEEPLQTKSNHLSLEASSRMLTERLAKFGLDLETDYDPFNNKKVKDRLVHRQEPMLVIEFSEDGSHRFLELRRDDILNEARRAVPELNPEFDTRLERKKKRLTALRKRLPADLRKHVRKDLVDQVRFQGTVQQRDIRRLDKRFAHSSEPSLLVRRHAIIVSLAPIRALLLNSRLLLFVPDGADSLLAPLMERLRAVGDSDLLEESFVMRSLEAILVTTCNSLKADVDSIRPVVKSTILEVMQSSSGVTIERLRQTKSKIQAINNKLAAVQHAFENLLSNDRDMALMRLDKVYAYPEFFDDGNGEQWIHDHEEVELLLENYAQAIDGSISVVDALMVEIDSAMSTIALRLDSARNKLLRIDLVVSSITSVAGIGALFAGLFGMNLKSGVSEDPMWFWAWFGTIVGGLPVMVGLAVFYIYRKGLLIT